jgi:transcriptional regulator with XRE-family HTH domain
MKPNIGQLLRLQRAITGQEQKDFASEIGITQQAVSQIERGMRPSKRSWQKISSWLGADEP